MKEDVEQQVREAVEHFEALLREQIARNRRIRTEREAGSGAPASDRLIVGLCPGDGIGPIIMRETRRVLEVLLADELAEEGGLEFREIGGFTLEDRLAAGKTVPDNVLEQMRQCDVLLKGPTTTPDASMGGADLESANVFLRKEFDLYANVRPVSIPDKNISWVFFRENTEGEYALGSNGISIDGELSVDFKVTTAEGSERIARKAFEYAAANGRKRVSVVTKANIMKKTDGDFLKKALQVAAEYPGIETDSWFVDIMAANLVNKDIRSGFEVVLLPNLYGDIITDEAAQLQGGIGTAGSANIGSGYAIFEAVHGSAPRMVKEGLAELADPASLLAASCMMLRHVAAKRQSFADKAEALERAVAHANATLGKRMTGLSGGATCTEFADCVIAAL